MIYFQCDYEEGCHPSHFKKASGDKFGADSRIQHGSVLCKCKRKDKERDRTIGCRCAFSGSGTQTNMTVIAAALKPWQGAICADTGHIACHETGAVEATGHKVLALPSRMERLQPNRSKRP